MEKGLFPMTPLQGGKCLDRCITFCVAVVTHRRETQEAERCEGRPRTGDQAMEQVTLPTSRSQAAWVWPRPLGVTVPVPVPVFAPLC